jgi:hypothetical protein
MVKSPSSKHFARLEVALPDIAVSSGSQVLKVRGRFKRDRRSRPLSGVRRNQLELPMVSALNCSNHLMRSLSG